MSDLNRLAQMVVERAAGLALYARQWLDAESAQDVVQEALTALLMQRHPPDNPIAWMYRAVHNLAIDCARSTSRRRRREQTAAMTRLEWFESSADSALDAQVAEAALRQLPAEYRRVVVMRIWGELGLAQIAEIMQLSVATVHERYVSALAQLRSALEKPCRNKTD
jgi:RNA polymerase sigma-70 factor (ECF subfamily)